jgi:hypothetical protein
MVCGSIQGKDSSAILWAWLYQTTGGELGDATNRVYHIKIASQKGRLTGTQTHLCKTVWSDGNAILAVPPM